MYSFIFVSGVTNFTFYAFSSWLLCLCSSPKNVHAGTANRSLSRKRTHIYSDMNWSYH